MKKKKGKATMDNSAAILPPHIQDFNIIVGAIFAKLYDRHPTPAVITPDVVASILNRSVKDKMLSGKTVEDVSHHTIRWLAQNGFLGEDGDMSPYRCTLTVRALTALNFPLDTISKTRGSELSEAVRGLGSSDQSSKIAQLVGNFFGSFTASFTKGMSG